MKLKCPYCGSHRTQTFGGENGNPFDRHPERTVCLDCGRTVCQAAGFEDLLRHADPLYGKIITEMELAGTPLGQDNDPLTLIEGEKAYAEAQEYMENGEWSKVFPLLVKAAENGSTEAETDLGTSFIYGTFGCTTDFEKAMHHLRRAAIRENARACFTICELYDSGLDITREEAALMCKRAAELGDRRAALRLEDGFPPPPTGCVTCPKCGGTRVACLDGHGMLDKCGRETALDICPEIWLCRDCGESFRVD